MLGRRLIPVLTSCLLSMAMLAPAYAKRGEVTAQGAQELKAYHDSGKYLQDVQAQITDAQEYLDRQLQYPRNTKMAIVVDVDETALTNYESLERMNFTTNQQALTAAYMTSEGKSIAPVLALTQYATSKNVAVFFVGSRPNTPEILAMTVKHLKSAGFENWQDLMLMPVDKPNLSIADFKTTARKHITAQGYDIVLNVGDQESDLVGGYAEVKVKIPNPYYAMS